MIKKEKIKKVLKKIIFFIINLYFFAPLVVILMFLVLLPNTDPFNINSFFSPQLSEETVLSISDNLSKITEEYKLPFYGTNFKIEQYKGEGQLSGKYVATIWKEPIYKITNDKIPPSYKGPLEITLNFDAVFYYDTISNCDKYYEVSYDPVTEKALCIYSDYSFKIRNPFSAKVIKKDN